MLRNKKMKVLNKRYDPAVPISAIRLHPKNARAGDIGAICQSIEHNGWFGACLVQQSTGFILAGNHRHQAAAHSGAETVPVIYVDCDDETAVRILIADNRSNDLSSWDFNALAELLDSIRTDQGSLDGTLYDDEEYGRLLSDLTNGYLSNPSKDEKAEPVSTAVKTGNCDDDEAPEPEGSPVSRSGDVWLFGADHRVMCGDSTSREDVEKLMDGAKAHLIVCDPPYNVGYVGKTKKALTIQNDTMGGDAFYHFLLDAYTNMFAVLHDGAAIYVFHADTEGVNFRKALVDAGFKLSQCCVWVKQTMVFGRQDYHWKHEPILYGWKPTAAHNWYTDRTQTTVWNFDRPMRSEEHPTMKPVALIEYPITNSSQTGEIVLDFFGGSGSTMIACEKHSRRARVMELDPKYVDVSVRRWQTFSGGTATLEADGRTFDQVALERAA
jgi:DNA modification methylase